jgi:Xaa-Pro aminopeptidase
MKTDIPTLMQDRNLDAVVVSGNTDTSSDLAYLTDHAALERALYLHRRDAEPVLFSSVLEREVAAGTGYRVRMWSDYDMNGYLERHDKDRLAAMVAQWSDIFRDEGIYGRVGFYGMGDAGASYVLLRSLAAANPNLDVIGELNPNLFTAARETKDAREIACLREVGARTTAVVDTVVAFLQSQRVQGDTLVRADGAPLTIGDVKAFIRMELAKRNLDESQENIFSQGRDTGVPHNRGDCQMPLRLGRPIIFDIFPRDRETGYYHDITRTFCLGDPPAALARGWEQVKAVFDRVMVELRVGEACSRYQALACDLFEQMGHATIRKDPKTQVGYVHSLGHGVGLDVHEGPTLGLAPTNTALLRPGNVVTVEPGLYYPDDGWGVRIEDTVAFDHDGRLVNLTDYRYDMVIPVG